MIGLLSADVLLYPVQTILHRLHLQGCRTIVDNLDTGREVIPIMTRYEGFFDCLSTVLQEEGLSGLFKGFGSLILQYALHFAIIRFSTVVINETVKFLRQESASAPPELLAQISQQEPPPPSTYPSVQPGSGAGSSNRSTPAHNPRFPTASPMGNSAVVPERDFRPQDTSSPLSALHGGGSDDRSSGGSHSPGLQLPAAGGGVRRKIVPREPNN